MEASQLSKGWDMLSKREDLYGMNDNLGAEDSGPGSKSNSKMSGAASGSGSSSTGTTSDFIGKKIVPGWTANDLTKLRN